MIYSIRHYENFIQGGLIMAKNRTQEEMVARREVYDRKKDALLKTCDACRARSGMPTIDHCNYGCTTGRRLRYLETEYSDVTGWDHESWNKIAEATREAAKEKS